MTVERNRHLLWPREAFLEGGGLPAWAWVQAVCLGKAKPGFLISKMGPSERQGLGPHCVRYSHFCELRSIVQIPLKKCIIQDCGCEDTVPRIEGGDLFRLLQ